MRKAVVIAGVGLGIAALGVRAQPEPATSRPATPPAAATTGPSSRVAGPGELDLQRRQTIWARLSIQNLVAACEAFEIDLGQYPASFDQLMRRPVGAENWAGPYVTQVPRDPWNRPYQYARPGTHNKNSFDLYSLGPDGEVSADDIGNWQ